MRANVLSLSLIAAACGHTTDVDGHLDAGEITDAADAGDSGERFSSGSARTPSRSAPTSPVVVIPTHLRVLPATLDADTIRSALSESARVEPGRSSSEARAAGSTPGRSPFEMPLAWVRARQDERVVTHAAEPEMIVLHGHRLEAVSVVDGTTRRSLDIDPCATPDVSDLGNVLVLDCGPFQYPESETPREVRAIDRRTLALRWCARGWRFFPRGQALANHPFVVNSLRDASGGETRPDPPVLRDTSLRFAPLGAREAAPRRSFHVLGYDARTGAIRWSVPAAHLDGVGELSWAQDDRDRVYLQTWHSVTAIDPEDGRLVWRIADETGALFRLDLVRDVAIASGTNELRALDAATGRTLWSYRGTIGLHTPAVSDRSDVLIHSAGPLTARDARTGVIRWSVPGLLALASLHIEPGRVVWTGRDEAGYDVGVVDDRTGRTQARYRIGLTGEGVLVRWPWLYAVRYEYEPSEPDPSDGRLVAIDLSTGSRWEEDGVYAIRHVAVAQEIGLVFVASEEGAFVRALDLETGARTWYASVGARSSSLEVSGEPATTLAWISVPGAPGRLVVNGWIGIDPLRPRPTEPPPRVVITGRVTGSEHLAGLRVHVGYRVARVDAAGRFSAALRSRGVVSVFIDRRDAETRCLETRDAAAVTDPARRHYRVSLSTRWNVCVCGGCEDCH